MATKHFFKTLIIFIFMIILGLIGAYLAGNADKQNNAKLLDGFKVAN